MSKLALLEYEGVLYSGGSPALGASEFFTFLLISGYEVVVLTNSSLLTTLQLEDRLDRLGISCKSVSGPALAIATLRAHSVQAIYAIGTPQVLQELRASGITVYGPDDHEPAFIEEVPLMTDVEAVVVAQDPTVEMWMIALAARYVFEQRVKFYVVGNCGSFRGDGKFVPGAREMVGEIERAGKILPIIVGKPNAEVVKYSVDVTGYSQILVVGADGESDVRFANEIGATSILIRTGGSKADDIGNTDVKPTYVCRDLASAKTLGAFTSQGQNDK